MDTRQRSQRQWTTQKRLCPRWLLVKPLQLGVKHRFQNHRRHRSEAFLRKGEAHDVLHIAEENAAENVLTCWRHMFKMETTSCPSCEKSWWTRGGVRQGTCELEKDLFQVAECDYEKVADTPEEALSPMASGKLPWMVGVKHRHIGFTTLVGVNTQHSPRPKDPSS